MLGTDTCALLTPRHDLNPRLDLSMGKRPRLAMGIPHLPLEMSPPVAVCIPWACPEPAVILVNTGVDL